MEENSQFQRTTAKKITINEVLKSEYFKEEGWTPNYLKTVRGNVSKINIIGVIISKDDNIVVDDSTGTIGLRTFENDAIFNGHNIGDIVLIIGKPREFNNNKYISPDIIRKVDTLWMQARMMELGIQSSNSFDKTIGVDNNVEKVIVEEKIVSNAEVSSNNENVSSDKEVNNFEKIINFIDSNDSGQGVMIDEIILNSNVTNSEKIITSLLEEGEIFEIKPGVVKIL